MICRLESLWRAILAHCQLLCALTLAAFHRHTHGLRRWELADRPLVLTEDLEDPPKHATDCVHWHAIAARPDDMGLGKVGNAAFVLHARELHALLDRQPTAGIRNARRVVSQNPKSCVAARERGRYVKINVLPEAASVPSRRIHETDGVENVLGGSARDPLEEGGGLDRGSEEWAMTTRMIWEDGKHATTGREAGPRFTPSECRSVLVLDSPVEFEPCVSDVPLLNVGQGLEHIDAAVRVQKLLELGAGCSDPRSAREQAVGHGVYEVVANRDKIHARPVLR